jgi:hypothetical protein
MINDMASLKQAMEQMDAQDPTVAEAAKDRAAHILGDAKLNFSKMAELIEQRRLLLRPRVVASIKRMDEPDMAGEMAFREAGSALRREGQSFRQIAEAIELNSRPAPAPAARQEGLVVPTSEPLRHVDINGDPVVPAWLRALAIVVDLVFFPLRHPLRFFTLAVLAFVLFETLRGFISVGQQVSGFVDVVASARQNVDKAVSWFSRRSQETAPLPISLSPAPSPSAVAPSSPATAPSSPPTTAPAPSASETAPAAPSTAPAAPPASTPNLNARTAPSRSATNDRLQTLRPRVFEDLMPEGVRRNSQVAGPCVGGIGGCYWGGTRY